MYIYVHKNSCCASTWHMNLLTKCWMKSCLRNFGWGENTSIVDEGSNKNTSFISWRLIHSNYISLDLFAFLMLNLEITCLTTTRHKCLDVKLLCQVKQLIFRYDHNVRINLVITTFTYVSSMRCCYVLLLRRWKYE